MYSCKETLDRMATVNLFLCFMLGSVSLVYGQPLCELISIDCFSDCTCLVQKHQM